MKSKRKNIAKAQKITAEVEPPQMEFMFIKKISRNPNVGIKTFRVFASRQKSKVARVQFKPVRKKSKKK